MKKSRSASRCVWQETQKALSVSTSLRDLRILVCLSGVGKIDIFYIREGGAARYREAKMDEGEAEGVTLRVFAHHGLFLVVIDITQLAGSASERLAIRFDWQPFRSGALWHLPSRILYPLRVCKNC